MDALTISAASGLRARMETLDMLANNLANATTNGFKSDREFYSTYVAPDAQATAGADTPPSTVPVIEKHWTDYSQGLLLTTGNKLDMAVSGKGFFVANGPSGAVYTRNGSFRLSGTGVLTTTDGYPVATDQGKTIQSQSPSPFEVLPDGEVRQDGQSLGRLAVVDLPPTADVAKQGSNYVRLTDATVKPTAATEAKVEQGKIESSNVSTADGAVHLVSVMRQFEMLQRAIALGSDMDKRAIEEVARIGS
jgi:flagellar basal-body rod protein FlgF